MVSPNIQIRGIRDSIPQGYILGRTAPGYGPVQLLRLSDLTSSAGVGNLPQSSVVQVGISIWYGTGAPGAIIGVKENDFYFDTTAVPYKSYVYHGAAWVREGSDGLPCRASFDIEGLQASGELLGDWVFPTATVFDSTNVNSFAVANVAATAQTDMPLFVGLTQIGSIRFGAGSATGSLVITSNPYTLAAKTRLQLRAPATPDTTLSDVTGLIMGT